MASHESALARQPSRAVATETRSPHNRAVVMVLAVVFGGWGLHRFYTGRFWTGLLWFLTGGLFLFGWLYDVIVLATGRFRDSEGRVLGPPRYENRPMLASEPPADRGRESDRRDARSTPRGPRSDTGDPHLEEAMRDPLQDKFEELEREMKADEGRDGSVG